MDMEQRRQLVLEGAQEIVTEQELTQVLGKDRPKAYVGYEPSGFIHIGWFIITKKLKQLLEADFEVVVLLADWHLWNTWSWTSNSTRSWPLKKAGG